MNKLAIIKWDLVRWEEYTDRGIEESRMTSTEAQLNYSFKIF